MATKKVSKSAYRSSREFLNLHTLKMQPVSDEWLEIFAKELVDWTINDENALTMNGFYVKKGVPSRTVARWRKRSKLFNEAHEFAKMIIGCRRETGALTKKLDAGIVLRTMAMYDEEWKKLEEWRADLKIKEAEKKQPANFIVRMDSIETIKAKLEKQEKDTSTLPAH